MNIDIEQFLAFQCFDFLYDNILMTCFDFYKFISIMLQCKCLKVKASVDDHFPFKIP